MINGISYDPSLYSLRTDLAPPVNLQTPPSTQIQPPAISNDAGVNNESRSGGVGAGEKTKDCKT
jgi:hypothetical protein